MAAILCGSALSACSSTGPTGDGVSDLDPTAFDTAASAAEPSTRRKSPAVTQIGREILPRAGMVVRGRTIGVSRVRGTEVARFEVDEVLRSVPWDQLPESTDAPVLTVFSGEPGMMPGAGREAIILVSRRVRSPNHDLVQVVPIEGTGGPERLHAYRRYLEIESLPREAERVAALLEYLSTAVTDSRRWTRDNAALEFGSLATARPDDLGASVVNVLRSATFRSNSSVVQRSLQKALSIAERNTSRAPPAPVAVVSRKDDLAPYVARYDAEVDAAERRLIVMEAGIDLQADAAPLLRRALDDRDERVREAAAATAGQLQITAISDALLPLLTRGEPLPVRRSTVRALGYLRATQAVPNLAILARADGVLGDDACYALGRVRSPEAVTIMGELLATAVGERRGLLEFLLSDTFVEQERALGRPLD